MHLMYCSKQTRVVLHNKPMTEAKENLEEVHVDLWGPHYPPSLSGNLYAAILMDAKTRKSWVLYLRSKDEFVDAFQNWLPAVKVQCGKSMKALRPMEEESLSQPNSRNFVTNEESKSNTPHLTFTKKMGSPSKVISAHRQRVILRLLGRGHGYRQLSLQPPSDQRHEG